MAYPPLSLKADTTKPARIEQDSEGRLWLVYFDQDGIERKIPINIIMLPTDLANIKDQIPLSDFITKLDVNIASQSDYIKAYEVTLKDARPKHIPDLTYTYSDVEASATAYSPPSGYFAIIFRAELETDANTDYAYIKIDDVIASKKVGASFSGPVLDNTTFPKGAPCKASVKLSAKAQATLTTNVTIRLWLWEVPLTI